MLSALLWALLMLAATVLAAALLVLSTPVELGVSVRTAPSWRLEVVTRLLGGLAPPIVLHDSKRQEAKQAPHSGPGKLPARHRQDYARLVRATKAAPRLVVDLLRTVHLEHVRVDADVGFLDPADTGQLYGLLAALRHGRPTPSDVSIDVRPDFTGPCASGELDVAVSFVPFAFAPPSLRFAWRLLRSR